MAGRSGFALRIVSRWNTLTQAGPVLRQQMCVQPSFAAVHAPAPYLQAWRSLSSKPDTATSASVFAEQSTVDKHPAENKPVQKKPTRMRKAVMEVTDRAKTRLAEIIAGKNPAPAGIRLGVRTRG